MMSLRSIASIALFVSLAFVHGEQRIARACCCGEPSVSDFTFFDPQVLGVDGWEGVYYDPFHSGFGGYQPTYATDALVTEWTAYLKDVKADDWKKVLYDATPAELAAIRDKLAGKGKVPKGFDQSTLWASKSDKLAGAVDFVRLARAVEPSTIFVDPFDTTTKRPLPTGKLLTEATTGVKNAASDPFLAQRYAFQAIRIYFYQRDFAGLVTFYDKYASVLDGPTPAMKYRARYYLAGALAHQGQLPRANLELAKIHANYAPLSGAAATDFHPQNDSDWREALKLAKTPREKAELWRLVGVKFDGVAAVQEILKLDPKSDLIALLVVRELGREESFVDLEFGANDPAKEAANRRSASELEQIVGGLIKTPGADRPWLWNLIAGHMAARKGDLNTARNRLQDALTQRPNDPRVANQVRASLSLALINTWRIDDTHEGELARNFNGIDERFGRKESVRTEVRKQLAKLYLAANKLPEAEMLVEGTVDGERDPHSPHLAKHWSDIKFIKDMINRIDKKQTDFDRFITNQTAFDKAHLEQELALRYVLDGDFVSAKNAIGSPTALSEHLDADPFLFHIKDCRECDENKGTTWTTAAVINKLADLAKTAGGSNEAAAEASLQIGHVLYNMTWAGNSRMVLWHTHQDGWDARAAEKWFKRAYDLSTNKETKAKAAYYAAKAERETKYDTGKELDDAFDPTPRTWFAKLKKLSDAKYYNEVIKDCDTFARFAGH